MQTWSRRIIADGAFGGQVCPSLDERTEERECNTEPCPIDCKMSEWADWGDCSATCGEGKQFRRRTVVTEPLWEGLPCESNTQMRDCKIKECPVDCKFSDWSGWSGCSTTCGVGEQVRTRSVTVFPDHGGEECPILFENKICTQPKCLTECEDSAFSDTSACSVLCGDGDTRTRKVLEDALAEIDESCPLLQDGCSSDVSPCFSEHTLKDFNLERLAKTLAYFAKSSFTDISFGWEEIFQGLASLSEDTPYERDPVGANGNEASILEMAEAFGVFEDDLQSVLEAALFRRRS